MSIFVDEVNDVLYAGKYYQENNTIYVFENASTYTTGTMQGTYDPDTDSVARINVETISLMVDSNDNLYAWPDSADHVKIYYNANTLTGDILGPDKTLYGLVNNGYGMDFLPY